MIAGPPQKSKQASYTPARNSECLCGSGHKFKRCCAGYLPVSDIGKKSRAAAKAGDYQKALITGRSDVTQYTIWYKAHTAPLMGSCSDELPEPLRELLNIDLKALSECVEFLCWCYKKLNRDQEFPAVLERLRSNIDHSRWHRKITYFHAIQALGKNEEDEAGKKELRKLGPMDEETDTEILQLYLDLFHDELNFSTRQILTERIVDLTESPEERLHYQSLGAINLLMVDDPKGAAEKLQAAIHDYRSVRDENDESAYALTHYASACEILGQIQEDSLMIDEAVKLFRQLVVRDDLSMKGIANAYRKLGDALSITSSWQEANDAYSIAFEHDPQDILKIFMSKCLLYLNDLDDAQKMLSTVETTTLTAAEHADYIFTFSEFAIESGNKEELAKAECGLRSLEIVEPYFKQQQNVLLMSVIDTLRTGPSKGTVAKSRGVLHKVSTFFRRYAMFEPNFMGMGFHVKKMIEDGVDAHKTKPQK